MGLECKQPRSAEPVSCAPSILRQRLCKSVVRDRSGPGCPVSRQTAQPIAVGPCQLAIPASTMHHLLTLDVVCCCLLLLLFPFSLCSHRVAKPTHISLACRLTSGAQASVSIACSGNRGGILAPQLPAGCARLTETLAFAFYWHAHPTPGRPLARPCRGSHPSRLISLTSPDLNRQHTTAWTVQHKGRHAPPPAPPPPSSSSSSSSSAAKIGLGCVAL